MGEYLDALLQVKKATNEYQRLCTIQAGLDAELDALLQVKKASAKIRAFTEAPALEGRFAPAFTFADLFGEDAKAGAKISALEVFMKFKVGYPAMRKYIKKWAEQGITVELNPATQEYVLK